MGYVILINFIKSIKFGNHLVLKCVIYELPKYK